MKEIAECKNNNPVTSIYGCTCLLMFAMKSLPGAYLWNYRRELNENRYIDRWPSEEVQSAAKDARASVCLAICPSGVIPLTYTLDAHVIVFMMFTFFVENHLPGNAKLSFLVLWLKGYMPCKEKALHFSLFLHSLLKITYYGTQN